MALDQRREQLAAEEGDLLRRKQQWEEKELVLKREHDELQLTKENFCYEKHQLEEGKERIEKMARQVEEESRVIYKYKSAVEKTRQELEQMRAEIDAKEALLRTERAKVEESKKDQMLRQRALEGLQYQYLKDQTMRATNHAPVLASAPPTPQRMFTAAPARMEERSMRAAPPLKRATIAGRQMTDSFRASDFIQELERDVLSDI